ncbi:Uncharacterised protein [Mycolicibacterium fortuitum]|uniref:Uncharacterized protein n=1 Tax=Mycolicibacterium fortuitum TaxID=1766 RepID=A0A378WCU6_MYCFO|nr:Uncharacterised protein [Mycolicibacterium fortuitum]
MSADAFLNAMDDLFGAARQHGVSHSDVVRGMTPPPPPATWQSRAAEHLQERTQSLSRTNAAFAAEDDRVRSRVDAVSSAVHQGKTQMAAIKTDYRINRARLASVPNDPEVAARIAQLDRVRMQDGANAVQYTQSNLSGAMR